MPFGRGFKSETERTIADIRKNLELGPDEQVDLPAVADYLGIEVRRADELVDVQLLRELESLHPGAFSACTFRPRPGHIVIVYNPLHAASRNNSDLAHELAHIVLRHELTKLERMGDLSYFVCNAQQEEEAAWFAGSLLLPRDLLLIDLRRGLSSAAIAKKRKLSEAMVTYRINVTGANRQLARARAMRPPGAGPRR